MEIDTRLGQTYYRETPWKSELECVSKGRICKLCNLARRSWRTGGMVSEDTGDVTLAPGNMPRVYRPARRQGAHAFLVFLRTGFVETIGRQYGGSVYKEIQ
jgi:hypothetical protein